MYKATEKHDGGRKRGTTLGEEFFERQLRFMFLTCQCDYWHLSCAKANV